MPPYTVKRTTLVDGISGLPIYTTYWAVVEDDVISLHVTHHSPNHR